VWGGYGRGCGGASRERGGGFVGGCCLRAAREKSVIGKKGEKNWSFAPKKMVGWEVGWVANTGPPQHSLFEKAQTTGLYRVPCRKSSQQPFFEIDKSFDLSGQKMFLELRRSSVTGPHPYVRIGPFKTICDPAGKSPRGGLDISQCKFKALTRSRFEKPFVWI